MFIVLLYVSGITAGWNVLKTAHKRTPLTCGRVFPALPLHLPPCQSSSISSWGFALCLITWAFSRSVAETHSYFLPHVNCKKKQKKQPQLAGTLRSAINRQVPHHFWEPHLFPCTERLVASFLVTPPPSSSSNRHHRHHHPSKKMVLRTFWLPQCVN